MLLDESVVRGECNAHSRLPQSCTANPPKNPDTQLLDTLLPQG